MPLAPAVRTGHIALAGAPNAGKSSLLNALVGSHLAIESPKAQSTRLPVVGLVTTTTTQYIFHDLPGLLDPKYAMHDRMLGLARDALERVHVILHLHPAADAPAPPFWPLAGIAAIPRIPVLTVHTKTDLLQPAALASLRDGIPVSARTRDGLAALLDGVGALLPEAPFEFDPDDVGTQPLRFFVTEYLREAAFDLLEDELPYAIAAEVEEFREHTQPVYIRVTLLVERDSQKGIVIGRGGRTLKAIGQHARARLEALLDQQVFLECWVKVLPNWRRNASSLSRLGFPEPSNPNR